MSDSLTLDGIAARAVADEAFRDGLLAAAAVCRAQGRDPNVPPCPSTIAATYIEALVRGELP